MPEHVFISYSRKDGAQFAQSLYRELRNEGLDVWLDTVNIGFGKRFRGQIANEGIQFANCMVVILTPRAVDSPEVEAEWEYALKRQIPVIPLLFMKCEVPYRLQIFQYIDVTEHFEDGMSKLVDTLHGIEKQRLRIDRAIAEQIVTDTQQRKDRLETKPKKVVGQHLQNAGDYFRNREKQQAELVKLLADQSTRIISVIGRSGIGKTALVSKVLLNIERGIQIDENPPIRIDGIVYMSTWTDGITLERLMVDCAEMLGGTKERHLRNILIEPELGIRSKINHLLDNLNEGVYVIVLDSMEDVIHTNGEIRSEELSVLIDAIITEPHTARFVITTQIPLLFDSRQMRHDKQIILRDGLPLSDGIEMLRDLDQNDLIGLKHETDATLGRLVELVHGVPHALELIARILMSNWELTSSLIFDRFYHNKDVIRELIEYGYRYLDNHSRKVLESLAVYRRNIPISGIDYVLTPFMPGVDIPTVINNLVQIHLVNIDRKTRTIALHPIDSDYAYSQIPDEGEYSKKSLERRVADYYALSRPSLNDWHSIDDLEKPLAEFEHRIRAEDYITAARLVNEVDENYLGLWGYTNLVLSMRERLINRIGDNILEGNNWSYLGQIYNKLADYQSAISAYRKALEVWSSQEDKSDRRARDLGNLGKVYRNTGDNYLAIEYLDQALELLYASRDYRGQSIHLTTLGSVHHNLKQNTKAFECLQKSLDIAESIGNIRAIIEALGHMGRVHIDMGEYQQAAEKLSKSLGLARELGDRRGEAKMLGNLGNAYSKQQDHVKAADYYNKALSIARETSDARGEEIHLGNIGFIYFKLGKYDDAEQYLRQAMFIAHRIGDRKNESSHAKRLGDVYLSNNRPDDALEMYSKAKELFDRMDMNDMKLLVENEISKLKK